MGTEVLRPQDVLAGRFGAHTAPFHRRRNFPANGNLTNLIVNRKQSNSGHKKTSPKPVKRKFNAAAAETKKSSHGAAASDARRKDDSSTAAVPVMGQVTLLRRGESLSSLVSKIKPNSPIQKSVDDLDVRGGGGAEINGSDSPKIVPKQIRLAAPPSIDMYAGLAFHASPSPRSVPLPSFFNKDSNDDCKTTPLNEAVLGNWNVAEIVDAYQHDIRIEEMDIRTIGRGQEVLIDREEMDIRTIGRGQEVLIDRDD
ncbi:hypothetical protein BUALT_Bualt12G0126400 [Buddleja alternifolia]|uniref:Uncharacterized protein n=1 Tax=Buddleja alternifolia TaxID=168488 RepID=A0AAV6WYT6_9LAMI|nr:hypothetical protein BUALT_Bualt12G0126400 [Buddleja alternifolia]